MNNIVYEEILKDLTPFQQATILYNDEHISEEDKICMLHVCFINYKERQMNR